MAVTFYSSTWFKKKQLAKVTKLGTFDTFLPGLNFISYLLFMFLIACPLAEMCVCGQNKVTSVPAPSRG